MRKLVAALLLLSILASPAVAQSTSQRGRLLGKVRGLDGQAWAGAIVTLHSQPKIPLPELGKPDTVSVKVDKRGRFRAKLLLARSYRAWAILSDGKTLRSTELALAVRAGQTLQLIEVKKPRMPKRVRVYGLDLWEDRPDVFVVDALDRRRKLRLDAAQEAQLGPLGGQPASLAFYTQKGKFLQRVRLVDNQRRHASDAKAQAASKSRVLPGLPEIAEEAPPAPDLQRVFLGPPMHLQLLVEDDKGKPVEGARVSLADKAEKWARLTTSSDKAGKAELIVPSPVDAYGRLPTRRSLLLHVLAQGFRSCMTGWSRNKPLEELSAKEILAGQSAELKVRLDKGYSIHGRLRASDSWRQKHSLAGLSLVCQLPCYQVLSGNSYRSFQSYEIIRTNEDGQWSLPGLGKQSYALVTSFVASQELLQDSGRAGSQSFQGGRLIPLPLPRGVDLFDLKSDIAYAPIAVDRIYRREVELRLPNGKPAAQARLEVHAATQNVVTYRSDSESPLLPTLYSDRKGNCEIVTLSPRIVLLAASKAHYALEELKLDAQGSALEKDQAKKRVNLIPFKTVKGRVIDPKGHGVAGARVRICGKLQRFIKGNNRRFVSIISRLNSRKLRGRCDAKGQFTLYFIPSTGCAYNLQASARGSRRQESSNKVQIEAESIEDCEFTLPLAPLKEAAGGKIKKAGK